MAASRQHENGPWYLFGDCTLADCHHHRQSPVHL